MICIYVQYICVLVIWQTRGPFGTILLDLVGSSRPGLREGRKKESVRSQSQWEGGKRPSDLARPFFSSHRDWNLQPPSTLPLPSSAPSQPPHLHTFLPASCQNHRKLPSRPECQIFDKRLYESFKINYGQSKMKIPTPLFCIYT